MKSDAVRLQFLQINVTVILHFIRVGILVPQGRIVGKHNYSSSFLAFFFVVVLFLNSGKQKVLLHSELKLKICQKIVKKETQKYVSSIMETKIVKVCFNGSSRKEFIYPVLMSI